MVPAPNMLIGLQLEKISSDDGAQVVSVPPAARAAAMRERDTSFLIDVRSSVRPKA
ncbi:hypothetical protein D3C87_2171570 [compost metagenome]